MLNRRHAIIRTRLGRFALMEMNDASLHTGWVDDEMGVDLSHSKADNALRPDLQRRLKAYFDGKDVDFSDVHLPATSDFQRACWEACRRIPRGVMITYAQLAARAGSRGAFRAAGQAMRNNHLPIIVPCHRVIGSNGTLHGFGGTTDAQSRPLRIKRSLLEMEGALADESRVPGRSRSPGRTTALITA